MVRRAVMKLVARNPAERWTAEELLKNGLFPRYFPDLYAFLAKLHSHPTWKLRLDFTLDHLTSLLRILPDEVSTALLLPGTFQFFPQHPSPFPLPLPLSHSGNGAGAVDGASVLLRSRDETTLDPPVPASRS